MGISFLFHESVVIFLEEYSPIHWEESKLDVTLLDNNFLSLQKTRRMKKKKNFAFTTKIRIILC